MVFEILNIDRFCGRWLHSPKKHGDLLPNHVRAIICGPSNSGKTNLMLNLLCNENGLKFENVYIFSKSLYQDKYRWLTAILVDIPEIGLYTFSDNDKLPSPGEIESSSVMIFDDVACEKQKNIRLYFTMSRHNDVDTLYLCQTYSNIPKQLVRDNANFIVLFRQDYRNLRHVYDDHVNTDMSFERFKTMCTEIWNLGKNSFIVIDKEREICDGRYRCGMDSRLSLIRDP